MENADHPIWLPVVMIILFGYVVTTEIKDVKVGVWDRSMDSASSAATQKIFSSGYFMPQATWTGRNRSGTFPERKSQGSGGI
jgi:ABC-2 type transport system permease protein